MKKMLLPLMFLSALALTSATTPAVATATVPVPAVVESVETVTADSAAVLSVDTVAVTTTPAPTPVYDVRDSAQLDWLYVGTQPTEPAPTAPAAPVEPVADSTAETAPESSELQLGDAWAGAGTHYATEPAEQPVTLQAASCESQGLITAEDLSCVPESFYSESYPAPLPTVECLEDMPCWDCTTMGNGICGNPACKAMNQFTVDKAGTCSVAPIGWTEDEVRAEGYALAAELGRGYIMSGANTQMLRREGYTYVESETIPSTTHVFN